MEYVTSLSDVKMPKIIYGTAWKKEATADLVEKALLTGFRGVDTACQPKHYNEPLVGVGIQRACGQGLHRKDIFVQTKFTPLPGQDPNNIPYDKNASLREQVEQSFKASQHNLKMEYIDSLVLHSPLNVWDELLEVWRAMEELYKKECVGQLGISNCYDLEVLTKLFNEAECKPAVVQNRFYNETQFDVHIRNFCRENNIYYQSFWTLTANPQVLANPKLLEVAKRKTKTPAQILFRYLTQSQVVPLTGTTSEKHMKEDLTIFTFSLDEDEMAAISTIGPF